MGVNPSPPNTLKGKQDRKGILVATVKEILRKEQSPLRVAALDGIPEAPALCQRLLSLKAKAVSVASAVRDGTATAKMVKSFLQEEVPAVPGEEPVPEMTADVLKTASALAIIKAMAGLMDDDPMSAGKGVDEYLNVRRYAEKSGFGAAIISPPDDREPIDPALEDLSIELYRMIFTDSIEDPVEQWRVFYRFLDQDYKAGLVAKKGDPDWNYR